MVAPIGIADGPLESIMNPRHTSRGSDTRIIDLIDEIVLFKVLLRPSFFQISNTEITRDKGNFAFGLSRCGPDSGCRL
jgi:hypothetical protein